ncbi:MAG: SDR family oxidoreductase [Clostridiales bacterium]|nr:SDR family oxidoreductase [Clostridiales bacterium]
MKDYLNYGGAVCVVTGAASGIGKATAEILVDLGAKVYTIDVQDCPVPGIKLHIPTDLSDKASIDRAFTQVPDRIDKFFGIAGMFHSPDIVAVFTVNFIANKYMTEEYVIPRLTEGEYGAVAFLASVGGSRWAQHTDEYKELVEAGTWEEMVAATKARAEKSPGSRGGYELSKRAINYYMKLRAPSLAAKGNRMNTVAPHYTETPMLQSIIDMTTKAGREMNYDSKGAFERLGKPEDAAKAIVFLNSDMATYISGHILYEEGAMQAMIETGKMPVVMDGKTW